MLDQIKKKYEEVARALYDLHENREAYIEKYDKDFFIQDNEYYRGQLEVLEQLLVENHAKFRVYDFWSCSWEEEEQQF